MPLDPLEISCLRDSEPITKLSGSTPEKYPYIDFSRLKILTHLDNDAKAYSEVFVKDMTMEGNNKLRFWDNKSLTQCLYSKRAVPTAMKTCTDIHAYNSGTSESTKLYYPEEPVLDNIASDFKVYVIQARWFKGRLPRLEDMIISSYRIGKRWENYKVYNRIVFAIYCATYCCGVSLTHLAGSNEVSFKIRYDVW